MAPRVLIVDDEHAICENLVAFLEDEGLPAEVAHSGEEAIAKVSDGLAVDVRIMDLRLPGMDGAETILAIRKIAPDVRFIVHTGSATDKVFAGLVLTGLSEVPVLSKPVKDMALFAQTIDALWTPR